jgi:DNA-binding MarR family transcriptional regulator
MPKKKNRPQRKRVVPTSDIKEAKRVATNFHLSDKVGFLLRRLDTRATLLYHQRTRQTDITPRQFGVLVSLFKTGPMTQAALSKALFTDKSTLGEMIQRMVDRGLMLRRESKSDRRTAELSLSDAGVRALMANIRAAEAVQVELLEPLPPEYRALFLKCLHLLADADVGDDAT